MSPCTLVMMRAFKLLFATLAVQSIVQWPTAAGIESLTFSPDTNSLSTFETHGMGLFQSAYSSIILGTIGDRPSDNSIHGGGFGSVTSSIGASKFNLWQQRLEAYYNQINKVSTANNPLSAAYISSLSPSGELVVGIQPKVAVNVAGTSSTAASGPTTTVIPSVELAYTSPFYYPNRVDSTARYIPNPYLGIGSTVGLSSVDAYSAAANIVGPPFLNSNTPAIGPFGGPFFAGIDSASASSIASRINGVPQSIAGGEIAGLNGQSVSVWAEAPDFTRLI